MPRRGVGSPHGEVSFVDFLLTMPVHPDDPCNSCLMKRVGPREPAGPETSFWITVRHPDATVVPTEIGQLDWLAA